MGLGLFLALPALELALWLGHAVMHPTARPEGVQRGERTLLCVGDSNTYGIHLEAEDSYPGRLQSLLDAAPGNPWRVVNLGYPGQNSAQVRGRLAPNLEHYRPEVVICWIGVNNTWSRAMAHLWDTPASEPRPPLLTRLAQSSRALGALRMLRNRLVPPPQVEAPPAGPADVPEAFDGTLPAAGGRERGAGLGQVEAVPAQGTPPELAELERDLVGDLRRIRALCDRAGARLVLVSYPLTGRSRQAAVNGILRRFASAEGLPLAPAGERLLELAAVFGFEQVLFPDHHATAAGNYAVARTILDTLLDSGLVQETPELRAHAPFETWIEGAEGAELFVVESFSARLLGRAGREVELELEGPPGWGFWVGVEALADRGDHEEPVPVAIAREERLTLDQRRAYFGQLDLEGRARCALELPPPPAGVPAPTDEAPERWRLTASANPPAGYEGEHRPTGFWSIVELALD